MTDTYYIIMQVDTAITAGQKQKLRDALHAFGAQSDAQPYRITHGRQRLDKQAVLMVLTVEGVPSKADFIATLAAELGISAATLNNNTTFTKFAGANVDERASAARDYIAANSAEWEPAQ